MLFESNMVCVFVSQLRDVIMELCFIKGWSQVRDPLDLDALRLQILRKMQKHQCYRQPSYFVIRNAQRACESLRE